MDKDYLRSVSNFEQAGAHLGNFAGLLCTYHKSLCDAGFLRNEALELVKQLQTILFNQAMNLGKSEEDEDE